MGGEPKKTRSLIARNILVHLNILYKICYYTMICRINIQLYLKKLRYFIPRFNDLTTLFPDLKLRYDLTSFLATVFYRYVYSPFFFLYVVVQAV